MRNLVVALLFIFTSVVLADVPPASRWYGIMPLRSTRAEVERQLGEATSLCQCIYDLQHEKIVIKYSKGACQEEVSSKWDVPVDTIISFEVFPKYRITLAELNLKEKEFTIVEDSELPGIFLYTNEKEGVRIEASNTEVIRFSYGPGAKDSKLRCAPRN